MSTVLELSKETLAILDCQELSSKICGDCCTGLRPAPLQCVENEVSTSANTSPRSDGLGSWAATTPATPASPMYLFKSPPCLLDAIDGQKETDDPIRGASCCHLNPSIPPPPGLAPPPGLEPPPGFGPPPGLTAVMSKGSELHCTGQCRPCQWFHKPQGCHHGAACEHCHLCGVEDLCTKRREKRLTRRASGIPEIEIEDPADEATAPSPQMHIAPSVGSAMHGTGACKPCAWFHKPGGCQNGSECNHCHLCPSGEHLKRKKEKKGKPSTPAVSSPASSMVASPSDVLETIPRQALALDALLPQASPKASVQQTPVALDALLPQASPKASTPACPPGILLPVSPAMFPSPARRGRASPISLLDAIQGASDVQCAPSMSMTQSSGSD